MKPSCHRKYRQPGPCRRRQPSLMWHSFASTLSNRMNRITLLTYIITMTNTSPAATKVVISPARTIGSICGNPSATKCLDDPPCCGKLKLVGKLKPPLPASPASNPTSARRTHWPKRNGCRSCRFVCWKAGAIVSVAEIGKLHLVGTPHEQGTANAEMRQIKFSREATLALLGSCATTAQSHFNWTDVGSFVPAALRLGRVWRLAWLAPVH